MMCILPLYSLEECRDFSCETFLIQAHPSFLDGIIQARPSFLDDITCRCFSDELLCPGFGWAPVLFAKLRPFPMSPQCVGDPFLLATLAFLGGDEKVVWNLVSIFFWCWL